MPLENAQLVSELNPLFPLGSDPVGEGDNHIRQLKSVLQQFYSVLFYESLRRSYAEAGYTLVDGSFEQGGLITTTTEVLLYEFEGVAYAWEGTLPKSVPPASTPVSTGGIVTGAWRPVGNSTLRGELATSSGASMVGFKHLADNAMPRTVQEKLSDEFHVKDFGAVGDGVLSGDGLSVSGTDDTASFINAIAAIKAAGVGTLKCDAGKTYLLTYTLLYPSHFTFDGNGCSLLWNPRNNDALLWLPETFQIADNSSYTTDVIVRNFTYKQIRNDVTPVKGGLFGVMKGKRILFEDVHVPFVYWHVWDGAGGKDCVVRRITTDYLPLSAIQFDSSKGGNNLAVYGVDVNGVQMPCAAGNPDGSLSGFEYAENCFVYDCVIRQSQYGALHLHGGGCRSLYMFNNKVDGGFTGLRGDTNQEHNEVYFCNNIVGNCTWGIYNLSKSNNLTISGNIIYRAGAVNHAIVMTDNALTGKTGLSFTDNRIVGYSRGFHVSNYTNVTCSGNTFYQVGAGLPASISAALSSADGCLVAVDCINVSMTGNAFYGCPVAACMIVKSSVDGAPIGPVVISGNTASSCGAGVTLRATLNAVVTGNVFRAPANAWYAIGTHASSSPVISNNGIDCGATGIVAGIYSSNSTFPLIVGNNIRSAIATGYGVQMYQDTAPRSALNHVVGFTAASQVYLDSTSTSGRHMEPFATLAKNAAASGINYTPAGVPL